MIYRINCGAFELVCENVGEFRGQTLFSVCENLLSGAFGLLYLRSVGNLIRRAEAAIDQSDTVESMGTQADLDRK